ncbi:uncharacterized protein LOC135593072 [Musa acuminata AAA Group]|uniref:uncharacterized protein LOC135593072 n=1 Tax=Musa acuminata AAA Group TaxID=214697 RepID=UPI0031D2D1DC
MDFLKVRKFRGIAKLKGRKDPDQERGQLLSEPEEPKDESLDTMSKPPAADPAADGGEDEDDDDFITNEVKRRLKELRKNSFMVLIPEEGNPEEEEEEEEEEESSSSGWRESEVGDGYPWCGFDTLYDEYCERMLFFDKLIARHLKEAGSKGTLGRSPRSLSKKLSMGLRNLSFKKQDEHQEDSENLQQPQEENPSLNLEAAYVAQVCLSWEALHCQYMQLSQKASRQPGNDASYRYAAQAIQHFQVLLQRFIENEPFEQGSRMEIYARARLLLPKLLQIPNLLGMDQKEHVEDDSEEPILATDLIKIVEGPILTFRLFLKMDKKKSGGFFRAHSPQSSLQQVQASLEKKEIKVKELFKKKQGWKKKTWPATMEEVDLLFALIDIKVISRVLRAAQLTKEQLLWCEEKMSKLDLSDNKLCRVGSPLLFPC